MTETVAGFFGQAWVGTVVGIIGILMGAIIAHVYYRRSRSSGQLAYLTRGQRLLGFDGAELTSDIAIKFRGNDVPRVTKSEIVIWNLGDAYLNGRDSVDADPLRVEIPEGGKILNCKVIQVTRDVNQIAINFDSMSDRAFIRFDFLDPMDAAYIEVLHTAPATKLRLLGTFRGMTRGIVDKGGIPRDFEWMGRRFGHDSMPARMREFWRLNGILIVFCAALAGILYLISILAPISENVQRGLRRYALISLVGILWVFVLEAIDYFRARKLPFLLMKR